ncbi:unnamed protein product, partial [Polarella glacialis]
VNTMTADLHLMRHDKASISQLQAIQEEVNTFTNEANANVNTLKQTVDRMMNDLKEHFRTATNTVAAHNAAMLQEVRSAYQDELKEVHTIRAVVTDFMTREKQDRTRIEDSLCQSQVQTEQLVQQVTMEVEEVGRQRRRDRNTSEVEIKQLQHALENVQGSSEEVASSLEHLSGVIWTIVQCERAASALDQQDNDDRGKVALMGYKAEGGKDKAAAKMPAAPIMSVDQRCLSCSGKANTVLAGFKMACLQYTPGPVHFARKFYNRNDLLDLRGKLLLQAHDSLQNGPVSFHKTDYFESKPAGIPSGGNVADLLAAAKSPSPPLAKAEDSERPRSRNSTPRLGSPHVMPPLPARTLHASR